MYLFVPFYHNGMHCMFKTVGKFTGFNNVFTLDIYNWNWLLDVVGGCLGSSTVVKS